jgi:thioredoxin 1
MIIEVNSNNFEAEVLKSELPVLVDFWAPWCGPCKMLTPIIEEIAEEHAGTLKVAKINVDTDPNLAANFGIASIPCLLLFKEGEVTTSSIGFTTKDKIEEML